MLIPAFLLPLILAAGVQPTLRLLPPISIPLPGARGAVSLDYMTADRATTRVWIPAGNTGSVDVLDLASKRVTRIEGFAVGAKRGYGQPQGPNAATVGEGVVFIGNRATSEICGIRAADQVRLGCVTLPTESDGVAYVAASREVWVTSPNAGSIVIVDASDAAKPRYSTSIKLAGRPEGYAVDDKRKLFFTNLEDKDRTLVIDVESRRVRSNWPAHCGGDGPRGLAYDSSRQLLFIACTDGARVVDAGRDGRMLGRLATGVGVDNIDYLESKETLYVAAGAAAQLTIAHIGDHGQVSAVTKARTTNGARVVVAAVDGTAVVGDPTHGQVLVFRLGP